MSIAEDHIWTFLSNYAHVLVCVAMDPDTTLRAISDRVGVTERAVHRIVSELEAAGSITIDRSGRSHHYEIDLNAHLRHPLESDKTVGDLLQALLPATEARALGLRARGRRTRAT